jgi:hypothetical protein
MVNLTNRVLAEEVPFKTINSGVMDPADITFFTFNLLAQRLPQIPPMMSIPLFLQEEVIKAKEEDDSMGEVEVIDVIKSNDYKNNTTCKNKNSAIKCYSCGKA